MGFFMSAQQQQQIRLRISEVAYETILEDISEFLPDNEKMQISSFLNRILNVFWKEAKSSLALKRQKIFERYSEWLTDIPDAEMIALQLTEREMQKQCAELRKQYAPPKRGTGQNIRLIPTNATVNMLLSSKEKEYYEDKPASYLTALIEEYAACPREKRELVFFHDIVKIIRNSIRKHSVTITMASKTYHVKPIALTTNGVLPYYYVIGYAKSDNDDLLAEEKLLSFRLQRIRHAEADDSDSFTLTKAQEEAYMLLMKHPSKISYLAGEEERIIVKLTSKGYYLYQHQILSGRPRCLEKTDSKEQEVILTFICTQEQIFHYFIRFGKEAEIIAPADLRERFAEMYQNAANIYNN